MGIHERKEREREERRKLILDAARKLLFQKGLRDTSIHLIAKTAEIGVGTIYAYFRSKEEIFSSLQEEGLRILFGRIEAVCRGDEPPEEKLRRTALLYLQFSDTQKDYFDIINYFLSAPRVMLDPELKQRVDRQGNEILSLIADCFETGIASGRFRPVDARKCAILFWASLHGMIQLRKLQPTILRGGDLHALYRYSVDQMITGFVQGGKF